MSHAHSHSHSPSPTPYTNQPTTAVQGNVRRNLFSHHLSRRPASSQQSPERTEELIPPLSPTGSPSRSPGHSPTHTRSHNSSDAIIATQANGRPLLPTLPRLPAHLRLSTTSDDDEHPYDLDDEAERNNSPTRYNHPALDQDDQEDRARIEKGLVEMMWRQRQHANLVGNSTSPRATRSGCVAGEEIEGRSREEEELMGFIMVSLRDKVSVLESEAWMYGESSVGTKV